jgi:hypothetical protein
MPVPWWNLRPDEDIAQTAHTLMAKYLQHVKSHQYAKHGTTMIITNEYPGQQRSDTTTEQNGQAGGRCFSY